MALILDKMCRTCMTAESNELIFIFDDNSSDVESANTKILDKLINLNLNIRKSDNLPKQICKQCLEELKQAFDFQEKANKSQRVLQTYCSVNISDDNDVKPDIEALANSKIERAASIKSDDDDIEVAPEYYSSEGDEGGHPPEDIDHLTLFEKKLAVNEKTDPNLYFHCKKCGMCFTKKKHYAKHTEQYHQIEGIKLEYGSIEENTDPTFEYNFSCKICNSQFTKAKFLNKHVLKHLAAATQNRKLPTSLMKTEEQILSIKEEISPVYVYQNDLSSITETAESLKKSISMETDLPFEATESFNCDICARVFQKKRLLRNHMLRMHIKPKVIKPFKCTEENCDQAFPNEDQLSSHVIRKHQAHMKHMCQYCKKEFSAKTLRDHIRAQHLNAGKHLCNICGKTFFSKSKFKDHTTRHKGVKEFICSICSRGFVLKGDLNAHVETHKKLHPYICDICGKAYTKPYSLTKHKRVHTGEKPFSCEYCPMKFRESKGLSSHRRTHTGERPYICSYENCVKTYSQQCHLLSHVRRAHTGEKPYSCDLCEKKFTDSNGLKYHRRTHTGDRPYKCTFEDCGKAFIQSFELTLHNRAHTGERPHVCVDCGSSFMRTSTLNKHRKIHLKAKALIDVTKVD